MQLAGELAKRIVAMSHDDLTAAARHWARVGLIDDVGRFTDAAASAPMLRLAQHEGLTQSLTKHEASSRRHPSS